jgi:hypothetical protein
VESLYDIFSFSTKQNKCVKIEGGNWSRNIQMCEVRKMITNRLTVVLESPTISQVPAQPASLEPVPAQPVSFQPVSSQTPRECSNDQQQNVSKGSPEIGPPPTSPGW